MEQHIERAEKQDGDPSLPRKLRDLRIAIDQYLVERGVGSFCNVRIEQDGHWYELKGTVDSHWTRSVLFALVPKTQGHRYIIDKLRVVEFPGERTAWA